MRYYADFAENITLGEGTEESPWGWEDVQSMIGACLAAEDEIAIRGERDNGGSPIALEAFEAGIILMAWDRTAYGPWGIRTTADFSIDGCELNGGVIHCRDFWVGGAVSDTQIICSRRFVLPAGSHALNGSSLHCDYPFWIPCAGAISLTIDDSVVQCSNSGYVSENTTATTIARNTVFARSDAKNEWYDDESSGYAAATWNVDDTCRFDVEVPVVPWSAPLYRANYCLPWALRDIAPVGSGSYSGEFGLWGEPRTSVGAYVFGEPRHYSALKMLLPELRPGPGYAVGPENERILWVDAVHLDNADDAARRIYRELLPSTCFETVADWERVLAINPSSGSTTAVRRELISAADSATGGLNRSYFEQNARAFGYEIAETGTKHLYIVENAFGPFRANYGRAGIDRVYDQNSGASQYTVVVYGTEVVSNIELKALFNRLKTSGTELLFIND